jgi:tripeptide aminopeptidase
MKKIFLISVFLISVLSVSAQNEKVISAQSTYKAQIDKISSNKKVQMAFEIINQLEPTTMKELIELIEIPAPPFMEQKRAERFKQMLQNAGIDSIWTDEAGNVLALRKGKAMAKRFSLKDI